MSKKSHRLKQQQKQLAKEQEKRRKRITSWIMLGTVVLLLCVIFVGGWVYQRNQLSKSSQSGNNILSTKDEPVLGDKNAPVTIVEFGDYACPYCKQLQDKIIPKLKADYISTGKAKLVFINYTIISDGSKIAANAAEAIYHNYPNHFWVFHDAIYKNQGDETKPWVSNALLEKLAKETVPNLDMSKFNKDLDNLTYMSDVQRDNNMADKLKLQGTPDLFVNGVFIQDPLDYKEIQSTINKAIKEAK